ncbi:MAG: FeS-binding protein, partial [Robiginitalea sp.]
MNTHQSMSIAAGPPKSLDFNQKLAVFLGFSSLFILSLAALGVDFPNKTPWLSAALGGIFLSIVWFSSAAYRKHPAGIKNNGVWFKSLSGRGIWAWGLGIALTGFYIVLYFYPEYLGLVREGSNQGL